MGRDLALDTVLAGLLYGGSNHRTWLSLVLHDRLLLELYGARVSGSLVLADRKLQLARALCSHLLHHRSRHRLMVAAEAARP